MLLRKTGKCYGLAANPLLHFATCPATGVKGQHSNQPPIVALVVEMLFPETKKNCMFILTLQQINGTL